jgi:hypothetical protein
VKNKVAVELTLPANASGTPYTAKDVLANADSGATLLSFASLGRTLGGSGKIIKVRGITDQKTFTGRIRLHLFHTAPTVVQNNTPYPVLYANANYRIGEIDLPAFSAEDASTSTAAKAHNIWDELPFILAAGDGSIYCIPEVLDAFTAADSQKFTFEITVEND